MSQRSLNLFRQGKLHARLLLSLVVAGVVSLLIPAKFHLATRILCIWNGGTASFLALTWLVMWQATPDTIRRHAQQYDEAQIVILSLITAAACVSWVAIGFMLNSSRSEVWLLVLHLMLSVVTLIGSWLLVHTIFAVHYAHYYYRKIPGELSQIQGGLDFPGNKQPDYWDFLYFSLVIGMTSQVSDVQVSDRSMRKLSLLHGVISFFFNTSLLAMSINIIAGLI